MSQARTQSTILPTTPPGYDLNTAQTCSFLVNVAIDMYEQWKLEKPDKKDEKYFKGTWTPDCGCSYSGNHTTSDFKFGQPIFSTFKLGEYEEPWGFVAKAKDGSSYLAFRGTQSTQDWLIDAMTSLKPYRDPDGGDVYGAKVHVGFYNLFKGLQASLTEQLKSVSGTLTITGHSLGSALATLAVPLMKSQMLNQASPKVGNEYFARFIDSKGANFRLVNTEDVVPNLPDKPDYERVGTEVDFTADYSGGSRAQVGKNHNPCCCYSYAIFNPNNVVNKDFE